MANQNKPNCANPYNFQEIVVYTFLGILGFIGLGLGIFTPELSAGVFTGAAMGTAALAGAMGGIVVFGFVLSEAGYKCDKAAKSSTQTVRGVVDGINLSFDSASDWFFPYTAEHDHIELVLDCNDWNQYLFNQKIYKAMCNDDSEKSPIVKCIYKTDKVCYAAKGSMVGAGVGAVAGAVGAAFATGAIIAGCSLIIFCALAILLAFLIGAVITAAAATVGGLIGAGIGEALADDSDLEEISLEIGDVISVTGDGWETQEDILLSMRFVEETGVEGGPSRNGEGAGGKAPYGYDDPLLMGP